MKNIKKHIHKQINFLIRNSTPIVFDDGYYNATVCKVYFKTHSEIHNQIVDASPILTKESLLK